MAKWEAQYKELMDSQRAGGDFDWGTTVEDSWRDGLETMQGFDDEGLPVVPSYVFGTVSPPFCVSVANVVRRV